MATAGDQIAEAMYTVVVMIMIQNNVHPFFPSDLPIVSAPSRFPGYQIFTMDIIGEKEAKEEGLGLTSSMGSPGHPPHPNLPTQHSWVPPPLSL